jgi:hypothetical protein
MGKARKKATPSRRKRKTVPKTAARQVNRLEAASFTTAAPRSGEPGLREVHDLKAEPVAIGMTSQKIAIPRGRRHKLTPEQIEVGINLRKSDPKGKHKPFCDSLRKKLKLTASAVSDSAIYRDIISKV